MSMHTQCPHCDTLFRVSADALRIANGKVRCGRCHEVFDALASLRDAERTKAKQVERFEPQLPPDEPSAPETSEPPTDHEFSLPSAGQVAPILLAEELEVAHDEETARAQRPLWVSGCLVLVLGLALQAAQRFSVDLAERPLLRPAITALCTLTGCALPATRQPRHVAITQHDVRRHPENQNALTLRLTLVNEASIQQPFPLLEIRFSDTQGRTVGQRRFPPDEYLDQPWNPDNPMPRNQPVPVRMDLLDPGLEATGFEFRLY